MSISIRNSILLCALPLVFFLNTSFMGLRADKITFDGYFGNAPLVQGQNYFCAANNDSVSVDVCRFYISDFEVWQGNVMMAKHDYKLVDLFDTTSNKLLLVYSSYGNVSEYRFKLGIDSTTNVAGVGKNDLDPTKGMYWTWQSGYINLKLEGASKLCASNRGKFQYHIGGYAAPVNSLRQVVIKVENDATPAHIKVDVEQLLSTIKMQTTTHVMSPSTQSQEMADHAVKMFSLK